jgi:DNA-3-methyladenine glycosylase I
MYAFMQAIGLVNDHEEGCHVREAALEVRRQIKILSYTADNKKGD